MEDSENATKSRFERFDTFSDRWLKAAEVWSVMVLVTVLWIVAIGTLVWILKDPTARLSPVLRNINDNWKAFLLLLIPIFYRTMKGVLQRVKKLPWGMEAQEPEDEKVQPNKIQVSPNPEQEEKS
jgi:hypothetical protein